MIIIIYLIKSLYSVQPLANLVGSQCWCIVPVSLGHGGDSCSGVKKKIFALLMYFSFFVSSSFILTAAGSV